VSPDTVFAINLLEEVVALGVAEGVAIFFSILGTGSVALVNILTVALVVFSSSFS